MSKVSVKLFMHPVFIIRNIVLQAKTSFFGFIGTTNDKTLSFTPMFGNFVLSPINRNIVFFSLFPCVWVMFFQMFAIVFKKFKVFYSIIGSYAIKVVDSLFSIKRSSQMLFHYIAMLKNSFTVYVNAKISIVCKMGLSFFKNCPVGGNIVIVFISKPSCSMHLANLPIKFLKYLFTTFNFTYLTNHYPYYNEI